MRGNRSVGWLFTRAFGALVALIVCSGVAETLALTLQHRVVRELSEYVQPLELANADVRTVLGDAQRGLRGYLLTADEELLETYFDAQRDYAGAASRLAGLARSAERAAIAEQLSRARAWWALADRQRTASPRSDQAAAYVTQGKTLFEAFTTENDALDSALSVRAGRLQSRSDLLATVSAAAVVVLTVLAAATGVLAAVQISRRITRPLARVVAVIDRRRAGELEARADPGHGPTEIRAVALAVNEMAEEHERLRRAEDEIARKRTEVRALGYRIRAHLNAEDALREAVRGLAVTIGADHVLVRMAAGHTGVPRLISLHDEHLGEPLAALAACEVKWLSSGDVWAASPLSADVTALLSDGVAPPEAELAACAAVSPGPVLTVAVSGGDECLGALTLIRDDGGPAWTPVELRLTELVAGDLGRGVHHARLYEREKHLVARLQDLDSAKTDFMSTVSHELRTPLTSIAGYVELLLDDEAGEMEPPQRKMLSVVARNTRRLRELIEDMLTLSKIESGSFRTARRPVDLAVLADQALAAISPAAAKAEVVLDPRVEGPLELTADPEQVDRILTNLLSNAVKFTPPGGTVTLRAERHDDEVHLTVADTGMGIPLTEQDQLFARFFRATNAIHHAIPGTGLGLAIVRTIVDNHHGHIDVRSTEGTGTTITIRLPLR